LDSDGPTTNTYTTSVTATYGSDMPVSSTFVLPQRSGYTFDGYFSGKNGNGTKYYNSDRTSAHV